MIKNRLLDNKYTFIIIFIVSAFVLYISNKIIVNNYDDNIVYSRAYYLMHGHVIDNKFVYLVNSNIVKDNYRTKYYLINNREFNFLKDKQKIIFYNNYIYDNFYVIDTNKIKLDCNKDYYLSDTFSLSIAFKNFMYETGSREPIYFFLTYCLSDIINYNTFILLLNSIFLSIGFLIVKKYVEKYVYFYLVIILTDFYLYVFLSDIHRLKLALIFLLLSFYFKGKVKYLMMLISVITHLQTIVFFICLLVINFINDIKNNTMKLYKYIFIICIICFIAILFKEHLISKLSYYLNIQVPYKEIVVIVLYSIYIFSNRIKDIRMYFFILSVIVFIISIFVGSDRVNFMLIEFIFYVELNRFFNGYKYSLMVVLPLILYNTYKITLYIQNSI